MTMDITEENWYSLEKDLPGYGLYNAKNIVGIENAFLAVNHEGYRNLLLQIRDINEAIHDNRSRGLKVQGKCLDIREESRAPFIVITCTNKEGNRAFNLVASDILSRLSSGLVPANAVIETLEKWRRFWSSGFKPILSEHQIKGLFGELWFLLFWLLPVNIKWIKNWVGPYGNRNDFEHRDMAIEVKTTSSIRGHIHIINGIDQLDPPEEGNLYLFSLRLRKEETAKNTIPILIEKIQDLLSSNQELLDIFEERLAASGYSPFHKNEYSNYRYRVISEGFYIANEKFPRLSMASFITGIPKGIERINYEVNLEVSPECLITTNPYGYEGIFNIDLKE